MRIGIDYDGVDSDSTQVKQRLCRERHCIELRPEQCTTEITQHIIGRDAYEAIYRTIENGELAFECTPVSGASESHNKLAELGDVIVTVTSLDVSSSRYARKFLDAHNIPSHHWVSLPKTKEGRMSKAEVMKKLNLDVLVDDSYYNLLPASGSGKLLLFFRQPWNRHIRISARDIIPVEGWCEAFYRIQKYKH